MSEDKNILWFEEITADNVEKVGGKNASLGEMYSQLVPKGVNVPNGFAMSASAFWGYLKHNDLDQKIEQIFEEADLDNLEELKQAGEKSRSLIEEGEFPPELEEQIKEAYSELSQEYDQKQVDVAVRSSGTAEDQPDASFAGQFETFLNISGEQELLDSVKSCMASLFNDRAIAYKEEKGFSHLNIALSVTVQKMVRSDLASSGIMFSLDTETGFKDAVLINSVWGVGEMIVQGKITPDTFYVFKPTLQEGYDSIIRKDLGRKTKKLVYEEEGGLKEEEVSEEKQLDFSLDDEEILTLAEWACLIEDHYSDMTGKWMPQDIEWAKDGETGELFIVQSRPETVHAQEKQTTLKEYDIETDEDPIVEGIAIGEKIGDGEAHVIPDVSEISEFEEGEVLVTEMTDPDWVPIMRKASAIVTDEGGKTCFAGETKILTDKGPLPIKRVVQQVQEGTELKVPSLNRETLEIEWKQVTDGLEREAETSRVNISQTGRMKNNTLDVTSDHEFLTFNDRQLIAKEIQEVCEENEKITSPVKLPRESTVELSEELGYLLGAIMSDGHISWEEYNGKLKTQLFFIQKPTAAKANFIQKVKDCFKKEYDYEVSTVKKKSGGGTVEDGRKVHGGEGIALKCYPREIVRDFKEKHENLSQILLKADESSVFSFLAGMVDGDGTYNEDSNRIQIFCFKEKAREAIIAACLRLGINFQVTNNRNIDNIQLVDGVEEIFEYTSRVDGDYERKTMGTKFFAARQLLKDIIDRVNYKGRIRSYVNKNLLIDSEKIEENVIPMIKGAPENHELTKIIESPLKMLRVDHKKSLGSKKVYNIEVEDNHNYTVLTNKGTPVMVNNCHAAIVSRELGIPNIVGAENATEVLETGQEVTVDCTQGLDGRVFDGIVSYTVDEYDLEEIPDLDTKIMVNIGAPEIAFKTSFLPQDGVGLAREEFIIAEKIRVHPLALLHFDELEEFGGGQELKEEIEKITVEHESKRGFFVKELAEGIAQIAAAFYPEPVIVRFSDFKTNEYKNLVGGELFEDEESNPMLGFRGACRYLDEKFQPAFKMEVEAIKRVREKFGLDNVDVMVPFCRTVEEGKEVIEVMEATGLKQEDLDVHVMCEIPSNVILVDEFLDVFDGMSIGTNDLTQLSLGMDRDNAKIAGITDERDPTIKKMLSKVINACNERGKYNGICGEAPSTYPEFAQFLQEEEIDSMSLNPNRVIKTILILAGEKDKIK